METLTPEAMHQVLADAERELDEARELADLERWHVRYFSRESGRVGALLKAIPQLPPAERGTTGKAINQAKGRLEAAYAERQAALAGAAMDAKLRTETIDVTMPARKRAVGHFHPIMAVRDELVDLFAHFGFSLASGPEVESDWYNFTALNTPADHPARDMQDTFYVAGGNLLRTQTSAVQIRAMERQQPPLRLVMPGRVYRRDAVTKRHYPIFHQLEGLMVDQGVHFGHLKGLLTSFAQALFGSERQTRFRPSFFPFTEPSTEVDVDCPFCGGKGCGTCSYSGWIELLGAGMVHPNVLKSVGYDPERVSGFAFGMGIERVAMIRYGINDIRHFWENDARFLGQF